VLIVELGGRDGRVVIERKEPEAAREVMLRPPGELRGKTFQRRRHVVPLQLRLTQDETRGRTVVSAW